MATKCNTVIDGVEAQTVQQDGYKGLFAVECDCVRPEGMMVRAVDSTIKGEIIKSSALAGTTCDVCGKEPWIILPPTMQAAG